MIGRRAATSCSSTERLLASRITNSVPIGSPSSTWRSTTSSKVTDSGGSSSMAFSLTRGAAVFSCCPIARLLEGSSSRTRMRISTWYRWVHEKGSAYRLHLDALALAAGGRTLRSGCQKPELSEIVRRSLVVALNGGAEQLQILCSQLGDLAEE